MRIKLVRCYEVDSGDILANGDEVIDGDWISNQDYALEIEKIMPDGSAHRYCVTYPENAFLRVKDFYSND